MDLTTSIDIHQAINSPLIHYAAIHPEIFEQKNDINMGYVTNTFKRLGHASLCNIQEVLEALSSGQCAILSNYEIDSNNQIRFVSSSLFAIDVDDELGVTNPRGVLEELQDICCGLFYTFSHGKTNSNFPEIQMKRYRLVFQLDRAITNKDEFQSLIEYMVEYLRARGIPTDAAAKNPTQVVRPGNKGFEVTNVGTTLKVSDWLPKAIRHASERIEKLKLKREVREKQLEQALRNPVSYEELKDMCKRIGYIPSKSGDENTKKWLQLVYALKHCVEIDVLNEIQGFELYSIISGEETNQSYWDKIKPYGYVDIGTIIFHAKNAGYIRRNKYKQALVETLEIIPKESIKVKDFLNSQIAIDLIERKQRLIVDSPTGSRKTSSFMQAFKTLEDNNLRFYVFAAPTVLLTEQIATEHDVICIKGGLRNIGSLVKQSIKNGERIFVCTFDKTSELVYYLNQYKLEASNSMSELVLVIDEVHKFTEAYNYRQMTINQLEQLMNVATSVIGLSGTPEDILKDNFEKLIKIDTGNNKSPCLDFRVFTYTTKTGETYMNSKGRQIEVTDQNLSDVMLIPVIQGLLKQTKVLVFINNRERIEVINKLLKREGIRTQIITSNNKKSATYRNIVVNGKIEDEIQVVLTTNVIADGVSIKNSLDWSCLIVADKASPIFNPPIFNPSIIKQISNRFRNPYRYFCIYMRETNKDYAAKSPFFIETDFNQRKKIVESYVSYLNEEFAKESLSEFLPSKAEKVNGICSTNDSELIPINYNPLFIRHQSMKRKELYYSVYRNALVVQVEKQIDTKCSVIINVNDEAKKSNADMSVLIAEIENERQEKKKSNEELRAAFTTYFDESIYGCFVRGNDEALKFFKEDVHPSQYRAMLKICPIADYETCKQIGENINKDSDTHKFYNDIQSLIEIAVLENSSKSSITKKIYRELFKYEGEVMTSTDYRELIEKLLPKKLKVKPEDVKAVTKLFHKFSSKKNGVAISSIKRLSIDIVARVRHKQVVDNIVTFLDEKSIKDSILKYINSTMQGSNKNILKSAMSYWEI